LIAKVVFGVSVLVRVCIVVVLLALFNNILDNLINRNVKGLNVASTAARNNRNCSVKPLKLVNKIVYFIFLLFPTLFVRLKSIKNQKLRLYVKGRKRGLLLKLILYLSLKVLSVCTSLRLKIVTDANGACAAGRALHNNLYIV
jgi:hypothetical protein